MEEIVKIKGKIVISWYNWCVVSNLSLFER